jgi:hypothetical protein
MQGSGASGPGAASAAFAPWPRGAVLAAGPAESLGRVHRQLLRATAASLSLAPVLLALAPAMAALALGRVPAA